MKKSPFSTPRGNGGRNQGLWNSGGSSGRGYGRPKSYEFNSSNRSHSSQNQSGGEDFIPFDLTPPPSQRKSSDNRQTPRGHWQSPRGHWQNSGGPSGARRQSTVPGYTNYRENRGRDHHQQQPFFQDGGRHSQGPRQNFQRGNTKRKSDISQYMNLRSFLEDPWSELMKKPSNASAEESRNESSSEEGSAENIKKEKSPEAASDSLLGSDNSFVQTSQEFADISACSDSSQDRQLSQNSNDSP